MSLPRGLLFLALLAAALSARAGDLTSSCRASSNYDLTVKPDSLLFDRARPAPFHVVMQQGVLRTDGVRVPLDAEDQDRVALFERDLRALLPRVRAVARDGVQLAVQAVREEAARLQLSPATTAELDRRLLARAQELDQRIASSNSTHDWQDEAMGGYVDQVIADLAPLLAADLGQQALDAALRGDLEAAAQLRDRAATLASELRPRVRQRLQQLRPRIQALCPAVQRLAEWQQGVPTASGQPLELLRVGQ